jgi:hypothetical protein
MKPTLEESTKEGYKEFLGTNFSDGYSFARYRASNRLTKLEELAVPSEMEVLNRDEKWQRHPVVFINYSTSSSKKTDEELVIFLSEGRYTIIKLNSLLGKKMYKRAEQLGLTEGATYNIKTIVKDQE